MKLNIVKSEFQSFLDGLSKLSDSCVLKTTTDDIYAIAVSADKTMFLWSSYDSPCEREATLNIPSLRKLSKAIGMTVGNDIELELHSNHIAYKGKRARFKYHLHDDGVIIPPQLSLARINSITFDYEFVISKEFITELIRSSAIFNGTNKLYITTEDGKMFWSLEDQTTPNTDVLTIEGEEVDFELEEPFIMILDNLKLIDYKSISEVNFKINKNGVGFIEYENGNIKTKYVMTSLAK